MGSLFCAVGPVFALFPVVAARRIGGGGGGGVSGGGSSSGSSGGGVSDGSSGGGVSSGGSGKRVGDTIFVAPTLEIANIAVYGILLLATLIQFLIVARALLRASIRSPAAGVVIALVLAIIAYTLGVVAVVTRYTLTFDDQLGISRISEFDFRPIDAASNIFFDLKDPAMFIAIALVLQNRHRSVEKSPPVPIGFISTACFLPLMMIVFNVAHVGLNKADVTAEITRKISLKEAQSRFAASEKFLDAFVAFQILGSIFLAISAFLVKVRTGKGDRIISLTLFVIIPLLLVYSLARLIFTILMQRLPFSETYTPDVLYALDFSTTLVYGLFSITIMSVLVHLLISVRLWSAEPLQNTLPAQGTSAPQFYVQGTSPVHGTPKPQYFVQGTPLAQFPGQWGYPQQSQAGYPQPQQYMYVPVYPQAQHPGMQPPPAN